MHRARARHPGQRGCGQSRRQRSDDQQTTMRVVPIQRPRRLACQPDRPPTSDSGSDSDVETERIPRARQPREPVRQPPHRNRRTNEQIENDGFLPETDYP